LKGGQRPISAFDRGVRDLFLWVSGSRGSQRSMNDEPQKLSEPILALTINNNPHSASYNSNYDEELHRL
jgi:hypothetical protein